MINLELYCEYDGRVFLTCFGMGGKPGNKRLNDNKTRRQLRTDHVGNLNTFVILKECRVSGSANNSKVIVRWGFCDERLNKSYHGFKEWTGTCKNMRGLGRSFKIICTRRSQRSNPFPTQSHRWPPRWPWNKMCPPVATTGKPPE